MDEKQMENPFTYNGLMENIGYWIEDFEQNPQTRADDMKSESQVVWNACMVYVNDNYIKPNQYYLKVHELSDGHLYPTNNNAYDIDILLLISKVYLYYCSLFDKVPTILSFSLLVGMSKELLSSYRELYNKRDGLNKKRFLLYKSIIDNKQDILSDKLTTGKQNPVGLLAVLNHQYHWNESGTYLPHSTRAESLEDLPVFGSLPQTDKHGSPAEIEMNENPEKP